MYNLGYVFRYDEDYPNIADFCNQNGFVIVEIGQDENGILYQIQEVPEPTEEELNQIEMQKLKQQLADMDYKSSKYVDGEYTQEEWALIVAERKAIRERIRELESLLK